MKTAIRVENLGKRYRVSRASLRGKYRTLRESLTSAATAPFRRLRNGVEADTAEDFWALRDVSFEVQPGEVVGIIGRNGAGKSTLLKILSRITDPTTGSIVINGRIASLLEVGTGFHPELTGRENIYLNGSILGMSRVEISRRFDEIVEFAEVETFIDTAVKRYSSGMYVRLAFAVAAHLDPEVLIVDEVLSVGDAAFQQKCYERMRAVAHQGLTVLLVSHQLNSVRDLCTFAAWLDRGQIRSCGSAADVIGTYLTETTFHTSSGRWFDIGDRPRSGNKNASFKAVQYFGVDARSPVTSDGPATFMLKLHSLGVFRDAQVGMYIADNYGTILVAAHTYVRHEPVVLAPGESIVSFSIDSLHLTPGTYQVTLVAGNADDYFDYIGGAFAIEVSPSVGAADEAVHSRGLVTRRFQHAVNFLGHCSD